MKTIVLGLGNPLFSDDSAGILVTRAIRSKVKDPDITIVEAEVLGLDILDIIAGYDKVIIIDAIKTGQNKPGFIYRLNIEQFSASNKYFSHEIDFLTAFELGKKLGMSLTGDVVIYAIEAKDLIDVNEACTAEVAAAVPLCRDKIIRELKAGRRIE